MSASRRTFLKGLSLSPSGLLLAPMLRRFALEDDDARDLPQRFVFVMKSSGIIPEKLDPPTLASKTPSASRIVNEPLAEHALPKTLAPLTPFRNRTTILQGLSGKMCRGGHSSWFGALGVYRTGGEHDSGVILRATVDAELARLFPGPFRQIGLALRGKVMGKETEGTLYPGITALGPNRELPFQASPDLAYTELFGSAVARGSAAKSRRAMTGRLLDFMIDDIKKLDATLPSLERQKLGHYLHAFEELQERRRRLAGMTERIRTNAPKLDPRFTSKRPTVRQQAHFDLIAGALISGITNVVTMRLDNISVNYGDLGLSERNVHGIGHREMCNGKTPEEARDIIRVHHMKLIADLARKLDAVPERDGTLLDRTMIIYMSDSGNEHHGNLREWPYLIVGGSGGRLKTEGRYLRYPAWSKPGHRTIGNWYTTLLNAFGNPIDHYGNLDLDLKKRGLPQTGPLGDLL